MDPFGFHFRLFFLSTPSDPSVCSHSGSATLPEQIELGFTDSPATNFTKSLQLFWNILEHFGDRVQIPFRTLVNPDIRDTTRFLLSHLTYLRISHSLHVPP